MFRRRMLSLALSLLALAAAVWAWYALAWEGEPRAHGARLTVTLPRPVMLDHPFVVQPLDDPHGVLIGYDLAAPTATRVDTLSGATSTVAVTLPFDRSRFAVFDEQPIHDGALDATFRGLRLPRPRFILINILGDGAGSFQAGEALTGVERLIRTRDGATLLSRAVIHGRRFDTSRRGTLSAYQQPGGTLLVLVHRTAHGATVWLFDNKEKR